jgi:hypothetical protein
MFIPNLQQVTVGFAVFGAAYCLIKHRNNPSKRTLQSVILKLLAASTVPTGFLLLACAFNTSLLQRVSDVGIYVAAAGVTLLFVSVQEMLN